MSYKVGLVWLHSHKRLIHKGNLPKKYSDALRLTMERNVFRRENLKTKSIRWMINTLQRMLFVQALLHREPILIVPQLIRLSSRAESFNSVLSKQSWFPAK